MSAVYVVIRAKGGHDMTAELIQSIRANTPSAPRIVLVDDGSEPPLECPVDVVVRHATPRGAVSASNSGMAVALADRGCRYVLILDNDTLIPEGDTTWLERFVGELEEDGPGVAAVGAVTNFANAPQHALTAPQTYAREWTDEKTGRRGLRGNPQVPQFVSFAVLLRASALREVGLWDTRYDPGNYEDTDYSMQLRAAGYEVRVARSVYIHHAGHMTFGDDLRRLLAENQVKFVEKWGVGRLFDLGVIPPSDMARLLAGVQQR